MGGAARVTVERPPIVFAVACRLGLVAVCLVLVLVLTACTPKDRFAARLANGELEFLVCDVITAQEISVEYELAGQPGEPSTAWVAQGEATFDVTDRVLYGVDPAGFATESGPEEFDEAKSRVWVSVVDAGVRQVTMVIDGRQLSADQWLNESGHLFDTPCGS